MCPNGPQPPVTYGPATEFEQLVQDHALTPGKWRSKEGLRIGGEADGLQHHTIYLDETRRTGAGIQAKAKRWAAMLASIWRRFKERCSGIKVDNSHDAAQVKDMLRRHLGPKYEYLLPRIYSRVSFHHGRDATKRVSRGDLFLLNRTALEIIEVAKPQANEEAAKDEVAKPQANQAAAKDKVAKPQANQGAAKDEIAKPQANEGAAKDERIEALQRTIELYIDSLRVLAAKPAIQKINTDKMSDADRVPNERDNEQREKKWQAESKACSAKISALRQLMEDIEDAATYMDSETVIRTANKKVEALRLDKTALKPSFRDTRRRAHLALPPGGEVQLQEQHRLRRGLEVFETTLLYNVGTIKKRLEDFRKHYNSARWGLDYNEFEWVGGARDRDGNKLMSNRSCEELREEAAALEALLIHICDETLPALAAYRSQLVKLALENREDVAAFRSDFVRDVCAPVDAKIKAANLGLRKLRRAVESFWPNTSTSLLDRIAADIEAGIDYGISNEVSRSADLFTAARRNEGGIYQVQSQSEVVRPKPFDDPFYGSDEAL